MDGPQAKADLLLRQLAHFQPGGDHAEVAAGRPPYGRMPSGIRGLRLEVTAVQATFTYDDHKSIQHRTAVAERLTARGQGLDVPAAAPAATPPGPHRHLAPLTPARAPRPHGPHSGSASPKPVPQRVSLTVEGPSLN
ncbi:hypothetical protein [Nonomuraea dietziae]|uniref:hypothetical protein n=1 Tax=Nonomuraea dietziae TaxID=65515 RepID=UPI00332FE453